MKIKAAVLNQMGAEPPYAQSKPLGIEEFELDDPGHGEVLVKIGAAGLCHSDLSVIDGNRPRPTPMVLGHEAAGIVEKLGTGRRRPKGRRSRSDGVRPELRALLALCGGTSCAVRARRHLPTARARCFRAQRRLHRNGGDVHHHLGVLGVCRICNSLAHGRWSRSTRSCRSTRRRCLDAPF